jgi:O-antigen/teichoic acid export membrane protein
LDYRNEQVGLYSAGVKVAVVITMFIQAFRMGAEPYFFKNSKQENARETYAKIMDIFVVMVCFIFLINCLFIDVWKILIAPSYYAGLIVVPVASLGRIFLGIYYNQSIWYKNTKQTMLGASIAIGGATMTVLLSYLLIPKIGFLGAAVSSTVVYFLMMLVSYFLGQKHYPVPYNKLKIASILCWTLLMFVLFTIIKTMATKIYNYESIALNIGLASLLICFYGLVISQMHFKEFTKKLILRIK